MFGASERPASGGHATARTLLFDDSHDPGVAADA
jgi:hypothetical protein